MSVDPDETLRHDLDAALERVESALLELNGASLLLTGGTGFFGGWLLALLSHARARLALKFKVTVLSRRPGDYLARAPMHVDLSLVDVVGGDVRDVELPGRRFSHVIHAATDTRADAEREPMELIGAIIDGTRHVLDVARACGAGRLLYLSSGAVYGAQPHDLAALSETYAGGCDPLDPRAAYGNAKRLAEHMCAIASIGPGPSCVVARCFAFVGPGMPLDGHFAIGNFIGDALAGRRIVVSGDGTPLRSYLYAGDLAAWLIALLVRGNAGEAYNVGSDQPVSIGELARRVGSLIPGAGAVLVKGEPAPGTPRNRYVPSIEKARALGLEVWTPLDAAILRTAESARAKRDIS
ncbi:NAD-dependent epimerase/dehydratase family protein [Methylobacterium nigriterrae]|uniref:NAD-dependent epimerase/dehydratase family protein n=1 Tax=Methylobacterium nigriterrae TaxID=3127512 RepID=UPI003013B78A